MIQYFGKIISSAGWYTTSGPIEISQDQADMYDYIYCPSAVAVTNNSSYYMLIPTSSGNGWRALAPGATIAAGYQYTTIIISPQFLQKATILGNFTSTGFIPTGLGNQLGDSSRRSTFNAAYKQPKVRWLSNPMS